MAPEALTAQRLRELLHYDPENGLFTWRVARAGNAKAGRIAGCPDGRGYTLIRVDGRKCRGHRLAWLYMFGEWPDHQVDHINGVRDDNRWINLRQVTNAQNQQNLRSAHSDSRSGLLGVGAHRGKWTAQIMVGRKQKYLGRFDTPELAHAAYLQAKGEMHPFRPADSDRWGCGPSGE